MKFNRWEPESSGRFTFLGFDFYWGRSRRNPKHWRVRRRTNPKKFRAGLAALKDWLKKSRSLPLRELLATLRRKLQGHWNYYGVIGNSKRLWAFAHHAKRLVFKWLNRRSQRKSFTWAAFARRVGALEDPGAAGDREAMAPDRWTIPATHGCMKKSDNRKPIMIEVPPARIPEEPGAVVPHAGICEGGAGQPVSLP